VTKPRSDSESPILRDPDKWKTADEPITTAQRAYLETLIREAGEAVPEDLDGLTKAEAAVRIEELQRQTGRAPASGPTDRRT
jgi:hypothetical protein